MRHAQSQLNVVQADYAAKHQKNPEFEHYDNRWINSPELIDATLTDLGKQQCDVAKELIKNNHPHIKYLFVSPMRRTVQTAVLSFKDYPNKLEWKVCPWFREILLSQCDIGLYSVDHLKQYPYIDASELKDDKLWFLNYYVEKDEKSNFANRCRDSYESNSKDQTLIDEVKNEFPDTETPKQMHARVLKVKEAITAFLHEKDTQGTPVQDDEIILVGHSRIIRHLFGVFTLEGEIILENEVYFNNTDIRTFDFEY